MEKFVLGVDYGSDSCRALVVNALTGEELATDVCYYPRWQQRLYCDASINQYRQHPLDYTESLETVVREALSKCPAGTAEKIVALSFDTTASTPVFIDKNGTPLALLPEFAENPNAMFLLWKDHTAKQEAEELNHLAHHWKTDYTSYVGGTYSSEWVWAKMAHILRTDEAVRKAAYSWVEHSDYMPALLTGKTKPEEIVRCRCAADLWNEEWGGLPSEEFLSAYEPLLKVFQNHLYRYTYTCDKLVGTLTPEWAQRLGLPASVKVGVGGIDSHAGAVGAEIREGDLVRVMGTSTVDLMTVSSEKLNGRKIHGIGGQVDGLIIPGMVGLEGGQSAFGDVYAWFKNILAWPLQHLNIPKSQSTEWIDAILPALTTEAEKLYHAADEYSSLLALDWLNGRRSPGNNSSLKGSITGLTLGTTAPMIYKSLVEATAFGSKAIMDCFLSQNLPVERVVGIGGISFKSPFTMQILADVLGKPIAVARTEQACALGSAMFAAVVAGIYPNVQAAQQKMGKGIRCVYSPDSVHHQRYIQLYNRYRQLGDFIEGKQ